MSRFSTLVAVATVAFFALGAGPAAAQAGPPASLQGDLAYVFTQTAAALTNNYTAGAPGGILESLAANVSASQGSKPVTCTNPGGCSGILGEWFVQMEFPYGITFTNGTTVSLFLAPGDPPGGASVPLPGVSSQATLTLEVYSVNPEGQSHLHTSDAVTVASNPSATAPFPERADFELAETANWAVSAGDLVLWSLSYAVAASQVANFKVIYDSGSNSAITSAPYVIGGLTATDLDGDGIPDAFDDDQDGDGVNNTAETQAGSDPANATSTPDSDDDGDGYSNRDEAAASTDPRSASSRPTEEGFPWLLVILILLGVLILAGGGYVYVTKMSTAVGVEVSDEGFASVEKGRDATFTLTVANKSRKAEADVALSAGELPENWTARVRPERVHLAQAADPDGRDKATATLTVTPPREEEYEAEGIAQVVAQPLDAEGNAAGNPAKAKAKTIVNIGVERPAGEAAPKKKFAFGRKKKEEAPAEAEPAAEAAPEEPKKKRFGFGRKKEEPAPEAAEAAPAEGAEATPEEPKKKKFGFGFMRKKEEAAAGAATSAAGATEGAAGPTGEPAGAAAGEGAAAAEAPAKPKLNISKLTHDPANFRRGDTVKSALTVTNEGGSPVKGLKLSLFVNEELADSKVVDVKPGRAKDVTFKWTAQPDKNKIYVRGDLT